LSANRIHFAGLLAGFSARRAHTAALLTIAAVDLGWVAGRDSSRGGAVLLNYKSLPGYLDRGRSASMLMIMQRKCAYTYAFSLRHTPLSAPDSAGHQR
jgi:hypothetical protein